MNFEPGMSKKAKCVAIAQAHPSASRGELISLFVQYADVTPAGASTYASVVRNETGYVPSSNQQMFQEEREEETDEQIRARLAERFDVIHELSTASCHGLIRSLIISGPPGLGKSHSVSVALNNYDQHGDITTSVKGFVRPTGLYCLLYQYRHPGSVVVLDDSDSIFADQDALNLLKSACDSTHERYLSWRAETSMVDINGEPIEREFLFEGTVIFITNKDFDGEIRKGGKNAEHFEALISRSHYVSCDMYTKRDYLVRIQQVVEQGMLRTQRSLDREGEQRVMEFIAEHSDRLRELSLRMALKLADVYMLNPNKFEELARISCFKGRF